MAQGQKVTNHMSQTRLPALFAFHIFQQAAVLNDLEGGKKQELPSLQQAGRHEALADTTHESLGQLLEALLWITPFRVEQLRLSATISRVHVPRMHWVYECGVQCKVVEIELEDPTFLYKWSTWVRTLQRVHKGKTNSRQERRGLFCWERKLKLQDQTMPGKKEDQRYRSALIPEP